MAFGPASAQEVRLVVGGADADLRAAIESAAQSLALEADADPQDYIAAAQADYGRLLSAAYSEGYYGAVISIRVDGREAAELSPLARPASVGAIVLDVEPGRQFRLGRAEIGPLAPGTLLPDGFAAGAPARVDILRDATRASVESWRDLGYAKARPAGQEIVADHPAARLDVGVRIAPGPRLTFGPVTVTGNEATRLARVLAIAGIPQGVIFSPAELEDAARRLRRTGTFASVALTESETVGPGNSLPIQIQLAERLPRRLRFGAEVSSLDGVSLEASWLHRNFLGGAERFEIATGVSGLGGGTGGLDYDVSLAFNRPATFGPDADLVLRADLTQNNDPDLFSRTARVTGGADYIVSEQLRFAAAIGYLAGERRDDFGTNRYQLLILPIAATWDRRNDPLNAKSGFFVDAEVTPFLALDGADNGTHVVLDTRAYLSPGSSDRLTFALRGQLGALIGPGIERSPADFLFFSGGGGTVRGQSFQSLGVDRPEGRTGGLGFLGASAEVRFEVTPTVGIVGFVDYGYISAEADFADGESHAGAGIGARYNSPIGPLRVDLATPISGGGSGVHLYIGIGQAF